MSDRLEAGPSAAGADGVRVVTLNIWAQQGDWAARRAVLIKGFSALRPDLVALQEVITGDGYDQAGDVLGDGFQIVHQTKGLVGNGMGVAIASRWPVGEVREVDLKLTPRTASFPCTTLIAEILAPAPVGPLLFVNHFPNFQLALEFERELQAVAAARAIEAMIEERERHVVLAGDLDGDPAAASIRFWSGRQSLDGLSVCYRDAWECTHADVPGHTFTPENRQMTARDWPFRRIDYIFVRYNARGGGPSLAIRSCDRIFDQPANGVWGSDHYGLVADLVVPPGGR